MDNSPIRTFSLPNGLDLLVEAMPDVQSAAFSVMVPAGSVYEPDGCNGAASVLSELIMRGAGDRDSRQLTAALDTLGVQRSESVGWSFLTFSGATLAENVPAALAIYADIVLRPRLPAAEFAPSRDGVAQSLLALEDEPQRRALIELRRRCYDAPWGLPTEGDLAELDNVTHEVLVTHHRRCFRPNGAIISVAGNVDPERIFAVVSGLFASWGSSPPLEITRGVRGPRIDHLPEDSAQTQIGLAWDAIPYSDPDYYAAWAATNILGGGGSSRLFTEVRERRGLCYSVYATLNSLLNEGRTLAYAGTTAERAQETLDVTLAEINRLAEGIAPEELERCRARTKSALIMQQESTAARAASIARDWFHLQRVVTLDEVHARINALTVEQVLAYVRAHPPVEITVLTMGRDALHVNC